jgi:hypothetical protein
VQILADMLAKARTMLASLRMAGTHATADHSAFEKIICALIPDRARGPHAGHDPAAARH